MSIYRYAGCECYRDADKDGCEESPNYEFECICDQCVERLSEWEIAGCTKQENPI